MTTKRLAPSKLPTTSAWTPQMQMGETRVTPGAMAQLKKYKLSAANLLEAHASGLSNSNDRWDQGRFEFALRSGLEVHSVIKLKTLKKALKSARNICGFAQTPSVV